MKRKLKVSDLEEVGACQPEFKKFLRKWPDGVLITTENVLAAFKAGLDVNWLVSNVVWGNSWFEYLHEFGRLEDDKENRKITAAQFKQKEAELIARTLRNHWNPM